MDEKIIVGTVVFAALLVGAVISSIPTALAVFQLDQNSDTQLYPVHMGQQGGYMPNQYGPYGGYQGYGSGYYGGGGMMGPGMMGGGMMGSGMMGSGMMGGGMMGNGQWGYGPYSAIPTGGGGYGYDYGFNWLGTVIQILLFVVFLGLIAFGVYYVISGRTLKPSGGSLEIVKERYAKGEITEEEYNRMKKELS